MTTQLFRQLIHSYKPQLDALFDRGILLVGDLINGGLIQDERFAEQNAAHFSDDTAQAFQTLLAADFLTNYDLPVLINFAKTVELYRNSSLPEAERIASAFVMSRLNFMGTDGIRGKISVEPTERFLQDLAAKNLFTPQLVEYCAFTFANMLMAQKILQAGDTVVIANDGRDRATDGAFEQAVIGGFTRAALNVLNLGIVPTAFVPHHMLKKGFRAGAMLTASHNPSNQNGIKFFLDGKKLLPEGQFGDFTLSALLYKQSLQTELPPQQGMITIQNNITTEATDFLLSTLPANAAELLRDVVLIFDSANGAFTDIANDVLERLRVNYRSVNSVPDGHNINRQCGVAELEGHEHYPADEMATALPFIKEMFNAGRAHDAGKVFGIALDGDGDRGFLVYYDKRDDSVHVLDGDKCGYLLAEYFLQQQPDARRAAFVCTIESDFMMAANAQDVLGLTTKTVSVGDKWIGHFDGDLLLGLESSGHLIYPIRFRNDAGQEVTLRSGIGLLTGVMSLIAVKALNLLTDKLLQPFAPGFSKTFYVFFVDKTKFYRNSPVWQSDCDLLRQSIAQFIADGRLAPQTTLEFEDKEDANILYVNLMNAAGRVGCLFLRNSGTEDKTAVYVKGAPELQPVLLALGQQLQANQTALMKNPQRVEYQYEQIILNALKQTPHSTIPALKTQVEQQLSRRVEESDFLAVLYGLKKEGRITMSEQTVKSA